MSKTPVKTSELREEHVQALRKIDRRAEELNRMIRKALERFTGERVDTDAKPHS